MILENTVELAPNPKLRVFRVVAEGRSFNFVKELWRVNAGTANAAVANPAEFSSRLVEVKEYSFLWDHNRGYYAGILIQEDKKTILIPFGSLFILKVED